MSLCRTPHPHQLLELLLPQRLKVAMHSASHLRFQGMCSHSAQFVIRSYPHYAYRSFVASYCFKGTTITTLIYRHTVFDDHSSFTAEIYTYAKSIINQVLFNTATSGITTLFPDHSDKCVWQYSGQRTCLLHAPREFRL